MGIEFLKKAAKTPQSGEEQTARIVQEMLQAIEYSGEEKVMEYTNDFSLIYFNNNIYKPYLFIMSHFICF